MRVLTFNSHQPYLHLLASSLPWTLGVVVPQLPSGKTASWNKQMRPLPANVRLYPSVRAALGDSAWDWLLAHNVHDLLDSRELKLPKVFLVHGTLSGRMVQDRSSIDRDQYLQKLQLLLKADACRVIYISALKQKDWEIPGQVIRSTVNPCWYGGYRGEIRGILQVCNHLRERGTLLGYEAHQTVCHGVHSLVLGANRSMPGSRVATDWEDLKHQYRAHRVYLHTATYPFEDGFNLALLEAMATGMPIATMAHPTSPIQDGVDGVVASTAAALRERVIELLDDPKKAVTLGSAARMKLEKEFPLAEFQCSWQTVARELT